MCGPEALDTPRGKDLVSPPFTNTIHTDGIHSGDVPPSQLVTIDRPHAPSLSPTLCILVHEGCPYIHRNGACPYTPMGWVIVAGTA